MTAPPIAATLKDAGFDVVDSRQRSAGGRDPPRAARFRRPRPRRRHRRGLLRRPRHRGGRHQLSDPGRCQAGTRHRRLRRGAVARPRAAGDRARQEAAAGDPRCLPRQSLRQEHETDRRVARDRAGPRQDRADQPEHADRLFGQGRLDRGGWRRQEQPVHDGAVEASDDAGARCAPRLRLRSRRRAEEHQQSAGAVRLWLARRRRRAAGAGAARRRHRLRPRPVRRPKCAATTNWRCRSATRTR